MLLDCREHDLIQRIPRETATVKQLPVADCWIGPSPTADSVLKNGLLIERKAVADFEASILDGRYREQRVRLLTACKEWGAHPVYIIEGDLDRLGHIRLSGQALMKHITRLMLRYHIAVFQTASIQETANLLQLLNDQWRNDPQTFDTPTSLSYVECQGTTKAEHRDDPHSFAVHTLCGCRGISPAIAEQVLKGCGGTLESVIAASVATLQSIVVGKKSFGPARAARLHALLHGGATAAVATASETS
jgi:ERCC4-type nuclease